MKIMNMENDRTGRFSMLVNRKKKSKAKITEKLQKAKQESAKHLLPPNLLP
jgi:hypothetical protein